MEQHPVLQALNKSVHLVGSLETAPRYALALADIVTASAALDFRLVIVFAAVTSTPTAIAEKSLNQMANSHARIKAVRAMNKDFAPDDKFRTALNGLLEQMETLASKRAKYVHGYWVVRGDGKVSLQNFEVPASSSQALRRVALKELTDLAAELRETHTLLQELIMPLLPPPSLPETLARRKPLRRRSRGRGKHPKA